MLDLHTQGIVGSDERLVQENEFTMNEQSVFTRCPCGSIIEVDAGLVFYCSCGRKYDLITYLHTEWAVDPLETGDSDADGNGSDSLVAAVADEL